MTKFRQPTGSAPKRPAGSAHACRSSSCSHRCGQVAPAPCGYRLRPPASAWQTNAARVRRDFFAIPAGRTATPSALPTPLSCTWCRRRNPLRVSLPMLLGGKTHYLSQRPPTCWITRRMIFALLTPCSLRPFDLLEGDAPSAPTFAAKPPLCSLPVQRGLDAGLNFWAGSEGVSEEVLELVENRLRVGDRPSAPRPQSRTGSSLGAKSWMTSSATR